MLAVALGLVFALARLLGSGGGAPAPQGARPAAAAVASASTASPSPRASGTASAVPTATGTTTSPGRRGNATTAAPLAAPTGTCAGSDVRVTPLVKGKAYAGEPVRITLDLTTLTSPACTWQVSATSVAVKLTSGSDRIWTTQDCPAAVRQQSVVVRQGQVTKVYVTWNGQRSDATCSRTTPWAQPGYYHVEAAALGGDPVDQQFQLLAPVAATITPSPKPRHTTGPSGSPSAGQGRPSGAPSGSATARPTAKPRG